jgi:hypothetical protein
MYYHHFPEPAIRVIKEAPKNDGSTYTETTQVARFERSELLV